MPKKTILQPDQSYTFRSYFELPYEAEDILAELGFSLTRTKLMLPKTTRQLDKIIDLHQQIEQTLPLVSLSSEAARREILIAPVLTQVARYCNSQLRIEYPLTVNNWLKGNLDYFLRSNQQLLVVEAKNDDLTRGFTQLAVELIALAEWQDEPAILYGAVTIGELWIFGRLDRERKQVTRDIDSFKVPGDLESLVTVLVGILEESEFH